jgi:hypothetical protein
LDPGKKEPVNCMALTDPSMIGHVHIYENKNGILMEEVIKDTVKFRYSQRQRNHETKKKTYIKIREKMKEDKINDETIKEIENKLSKYDSKTTDFNKFREYIQEKCKINNLLYEHYQKYIYRILKWNEYINTQRSEDMMLDNFEKKYGSKDEVMLVIGDYSEKSHKKGNEPTIIKRMRWLFKKRGYEIYLIDEFRTSKLCHICEHETDNFLEISRLNKKGVVNQYLLWKLVRCQSAPKQKYIRLRMYFCLVSHF